METDQGKETLSFKDSIEHEAERIIPEYEKMKQNKNYYGRKYYWYSHVEAGIYIKYLKRWIEMFPKNQLLVVKSEDLFEKTTETYNKVLEFLGLKINTNASMLNEKLIHSILSSNFSEIVFSVDAADKDAYEKIRINGINEASIDGC